MMRPSLSTRVLILSSTVLLGMAAAVACGEGDASLETSRPDASARELSTDAAPSDASDGRLVTTIRLVHAARGVGPVDLCYKAARSTFVGPVQKTPAPGAGDDGGLEGGTDAGSSLGFGEVLPYVTLAESGPMTLALVAAGSTSCSSPLATADVTLDPGKLHTVVFFGLPVDGGPRPLAAFVDDPVTVGGRARVRVLHAASRFGPLAARVATSTTTLLAERVEPRSVPSPSAVVPVDALGYATVAPVTGPASLAIDFFDGAQAPWQSAPQDLELAGGSLHTAFVLDDGAEIDVLWCADERTACTRIP